MSSSLDQCPSCSARIGTPRPARCEFCGSPLPALPAAPDPLPRPSPVLTTEQLEEQLAQFGDVARRKRAGSLQRKAVFFVLLLFAVALAMMMLSVRAPQPPPTSAQPAQPASH